MSSISLFSTGHQRPTKMTRTRRAGNATARAVRLGALTLAAALLSAAPAPANDPLATIRAFCANDGAGGRLSPNSWPRIADIVDWQLEPAWDHIKVIRGYEIQTPRRLGDRVVAEVTYYMAANIHPGRIVKRTGTEIIRLELSADENGTWRVHGPPPIPRVFDYVADLDALSALLEPEDPTYESNSSLVWRELVQRGSAIAYLPVGELQRADFLDETATSAIGDIVIYFAGGAPYHTGVVVADDLVLSATMNAGVVETPFAAFPGTVRYWRPVHQVTKPGKSPKPKRRKRRK